VNYAVAQINGSTYLYLRTLSEPKDNELEIVLEEAGSGPKDGISEIRGPFSERARSFTGPTIECSKCRGSHTWLTQFAMRVRLSKTTTNNLRAGYSLSLAARATWILWRKVRSHLTTTPARSSTGASFALITLSMLYLFMPQRLKSFGPNQRLEKDLRPARFARWSRPLSLSRHTAI
jgi:hypothetical protein